MMDWFLRLMKVTYVIESKFQRRAKINIVCALVLFLLVECAFFV